MQSYPLQWPPDWPRTKYLCDSRFGHGQKKPSVHVGTQEVLQELERMGAAQVVISTNIVLRKDGLPHGGAAAPSDTGVAVYFRREGKAMVLAVDSFNRIGCNLHAISLGIAAIRGLDRWGLKQMQDRAFHGFALPSPDMVTPPEWWQLLGFASPIEDKELIRAQRQILMKRYHPDWGTEPNHEKAAEINAAADKGLRG